MLRNNLKRMILSGARAVGAFRRADYNYRGWLRILSYHGVGDDVRADLNADGMVVSEEMFDMQMRILKEHYVVLPLVEACRALNEGTLAHNAVALTFDDGYLNNYETASAILSRYSFPATFFVTTSFMDGARYPWWWALRKAVMDGLCAGVSGAELPALEASLRNRSLVERDAELARLGVVCAWSEGLPKMMDWELVEILARQGFDIGGHTMHHVSLAHESDETIRMEVLDGLQVLEREGITPSACFAYPYGKYSNLAVPEELFEEAGIEFAVMDETGINYPDSHPLMLKRMGITDNHDALAFEGTVSGFTARLGRFR
jgi:peptidoglycan/xylan/chitin deacetylase (PgdA/CDA1 family)